MKSAGCVCVRARACKNMKAKRQLSEEREGKTTEQEIQPEETLGESLQLNPKGEDGKANNCAPVGLGPSS